MLTELREVIEQAIARRERQIRDRVIGTALENRLTDAGVRRMAQQAFAGYYDLADDDEWREFLFVILANSY